MLTLLSQFPNALAYLSKMPVDGDINCTTQDIQECILYLIVSNSTRCRCAENDTPENHFKAWNDVAYLKR